MAFASPGENGVAIIGLMSGTSLDAVDASLVVVDHNGENVLRVGKSVEVKIPNNLRDECLALSKRCTQDLAFARTCASISVDQAKSFRDKGILKLEKSITEIHAKAVKRLLHILSTSECADQPVRLIGFHGQTI